MKPPPTAVVPPSFSPLARLGFSALVYFSTQVLAFRFPDSFGLIAAIWPAAGVALAALLLSPRRHWPVLLGCLFAAGIAANLTTARPIFASVGFMVANVCETAASAWLITRLCGNQIRFTRVREVLALMGAAVVINAATALIGAGAARLALGAEFWTFYATWWVADGLGLLLITPLIVIWADAPRPLAGLRWGRLIEAAVLLALGCTVTWVIFGLERLPFAIELKTYLLLGFVIWAAVRCGLRTTVLLLAAFSIIAVGCTAAGLGHFPLGGADAPLRLLSVQVFLGVVGMTGLMLAAAIAEHQQAIVAVRESETKFRLLAENIQDVFWLSTPSIERTIYVSPQFEKIWGRTCASLYQRPQSFMEAVHPEDQGRVSAALQGHAQGKWEVEYRILRPDGSRRWILDRGFPIRDESGKLTFMCGVASDITEHKQAEAALRQKAEALRASNAELEQFNRAMVGRELRMIELKQEINELCRRLGEPPRHETDQFQTGRIPGAGSAPAPPGRGGA